MKLFVGIGRYRLVIRDAGSLKDKRRILKSLVDRIGNSKVVAVCEVGDNDYWKSSVLAVTCVSSAHDLVGRLLEQTRQVIEVSGAEVVEKEQWVFNPEDISEPLQCRDE